MDRIGAARRVKTLAREAGFELAGVATLGPATTAAAYRRWLEEGQQAGMAWMARNVDLRADPRGLLPGARSALVVGLRYAPHRDEGELPAESFWRGVARYARGRDYHELLRERLAAVALAVAAEFPASASRICVDTAPLLERELAARAGLGAIGKNTNLLHPEFGSWFLLGELLLTLDLAADTPLADLCGNCSRCLDACPTGALPAPYRLDANRCLSYWTIEHRGDIPAQFHEHLARWHFGCDICQEVCPWNASAPEVDDVSLAPSFESRTLTLREIAALDEAGYRERFRGSALRRARLEGLRRNAGLAVGAGAGGGGLTPSAEKT